MLRKVQYTIFFKQWLRSPISFYPVVASFRPSESFIFSRVPGEKREKEWKLSWNMLWSELEIHWPELSHMALSRCKRDQEMCWGVCHGENIIEHKQPLAHREPLSSFHSHIISDDQPLSRVYFYLHTPLTIPATLLPSLS